MPQPKNASRLNASRRGGKFLPMKIRPMRICRFILALRQWRLRAVWYACRVSLWSRRSRLDLAWPPSVQKVQPPATCRCQVGQASAPLRMIYSRTRSTRVLLTIVRSAQTPATPMTATRVPSAGFRTPDGPSTSTSAPHGVSVLRPIDASDPLYTIEPVSLTCDKILGIPVSLETSRKRASRRR